MHGFFSGTKFKIILCLIVCLLMGVFVAAVSGDGSSPVSHYASVVLSPLTKAAEFAAEKLSDLNISFKSSNKYKEEVESLRNELETYRTELRDYYDTMHKLDSYEAFLEIKSENPDYTFEPASVILRDTGDIYGSFVIDKGTDDGISVNDPVIYGQYLVGCVKEVSAESSTVYTLLHPKVSASVYEVRTREDCYTESDSTLLSSGCIRISGLSRSTPVVPGGIICTSGTGGIFPKGLIVGTVNEVFTNDTDISAYASVTPGTELNALTDVFVITSFNGQGGAE